MKKLFFLAVIIMALLFSGCSNEQISDKNGVTAKDYLENKGYKIVSYEGNTENYVLTKDKLMSMPYSIFWGLQAEDPGKYLTKDIHIEKFIIKNHPLDNWQSTSKEPKNIVKSKGKTYVWVYVVDDKVVGGNSYPVIDEQMVGGYWSLEGKTLEEVHSITYSDWVEQWKEKFGS